MAADRVVILPAGLKITVLEVINIMTSPRPVTHISPTQHWTLETLQGAGQALPGVVLRIVNKIVATTNLALARSLTKSLRIFWDNIHVHPVK